MGEAIFGTILIISQEYRKNLAPYVIDAIPLIQSAQQSNTPILIEGANALMLDIDYGTYPYVTSSVSIFIRL
jgi:adenylosuccinate synthase